MRKVLFALMLIFAATQIFQAKAVDTYVTIDSLKYRLYYPGSHPEWATNNEESIAVLENVAYGKHDVSIPYEITYNGRVFRVAGIVCHLYGSIPKDDDYLMKHTDNVTVTFADNADLYIDVPSTYGDSSDKLGGHVKKIVFGKNVYLHGFDSNFDYQRNLLGVVNNTCEIYCYDERPIPYLIGNGVSLFDVSGTSRPNLYVPKGSELDYRYTPGWCNFNIIGLEELGNVTESNVTSASFNFNQKSAIIDTHTMTALPIAIDNKNELSAIEFDVVLPANVETQGENPIMGSERGAEMSFSTTANEDGSLHVVATATTALAAGKGNIATVAIQTAKSDNYAITLRNVKVTTKTGKVISLDNEALQFVANHKKGDYNEDGDVDVVDAQSLLNYVLRI